MEPDEIFEDETGLGSANESIDRLSPEWSDFVMTQFTDEELVEIDGKTCPNVAGLRRVSELLMGPIVSSKVTKLHVSPDFRSAFSSYEVSFLTPNGVVTFGDAADLHEGNCTAFFLDFSAASVVTRAEARALRKALKLRTVAAEEMPKGGNKVQKVGRDKITSAQLYFLDLQFKKFDINGKKYLNSGSKTYDSIKEEMSYDTAVKASIELQRYMNGEVVPKSMTGYKPGWDV